MLDHGNNTGTEFEMTPARKDLGAYMVQKDNNGKWKRHGKADRYEQLAKELDKAKTPNGKQLSSKEIRQNLRNILNKKNPPNPMDKKTTLQVRFAASVLMTDMARGSAGPILVETFLKVNNPGTFLESWKRNINAKYPPAVPSTLGKKNNPMGSKYIQNASQEKKKDPSKFDPEKMVE